jgi:predicted NAD/FAD-binding protein
MSFSSSYARCSLEFGSAGLRALFAQPENLGRLRHWRLLGEILRFFQVGRAALHDQRASHLTLGELLARRHISRDAIDHFVVPMGAAIWSTDARTMLDFPAIMFLRFYANHGMLAPIGAPRWRTVVGGSKVYVRALLESTRLQLHRGSRVVRLERDGSGVGVVVQGGPPRRFDRAVVATHSDQALALLQDPTADETRVLGAVRYIDNDVWLHTDESFLPAPRARASWNYHTDDCRAPAPLVGATYWMNRLQGLTAERQYLITLNPPRPIAPDQVVRRLRAAHPLFDFAALRAQRLVPRIQGSRHTYFAGAWQGYGFHEDGLRSGMEAAAVLQRDAGGQPRMSAA